MADVASEFHRIARMGLDRNLEVEEEELRLYRQCGRKKRSWKDEFRFFTCSEVCKQRQPTLVVSTDPSHSLSDSFAQVHQAKFCVGVKTTYSCYNSEEEDEELQDLDAPRILSDPISSFKDHYDDDYNNSDGEGEDVEYSLNNMFITPKQTFNLHMPAKTRPFVNSFYC